MGNAGLATLQCAIAAALWLIVGVLYVRLQPRIALNARLSPLVRTTLTAAMAGAVALGGGLVIWLFSSTYRPASSAGATPSFALAATLWVVVCMLIGRTQATVSRSERLTPVVKNALLAGLAAAIPLTGGLVMWLFDIASSTAIVSNGAR